MENLFKETANFFTLHWPQGAAEPPVWDTSYRFIGALPNHDHCGCYALLDDRGVYYIGSGVSRGHGRYVNHGIGMRTNAHVLMLDAVGPLSERLYKFRSPWRHCTQIVTIGFPHEYSYLSLALEWYLITRLSPIGNEKGRSSR